MKNIRNFYLNFFLFFVCKMLMKACFRNAVRRLLFLCVGGRGGGGGEGGDVIQICQ